MEAVIRLGQRNRAVDGVDIYTRSPSPLQDMNFNPVEAFQDFTQFARYLPPELHEGPLIAPFVYSIQHMFMPPVVHRSLATVYSDHDVRNRHYQELMHAYLHLTADRLADMSPCYIDFWRSYIPAMAFGPNGSLALLNAMVALAALHIAPLQADDSRGKLRAWEFYHLALQHQGNATASSPDDWVLATSLILAHYEVTPLQPLSDSSYGMGRSPRWAHICLAPKTSLTSAERKLVKPPSDERSSPSSFDQT